jgi:RecB family exonuclease
MTTTVRTASSVEAGSSGPRLQVTGYGRAALEALAGIVAEAKRSDPLAPVTVLAPSTVAGIIARRHLAAGVGGRPGIAGLAVTTLDRLAEQIAAPLLAPARPATAPIVAAAWRSALAADPGAFEPVADHPATIRALARAHAELRDLDPPGSLRDAARATAPAGTDDAPVGATEQPVAPPDRIARSGELSEHLVRLHRRVRAAVRRGFYDRTDLLHAAADALHEDPARAAEWGSVVLYLPQDLTLAQARFARAVADRAPVTVLAGLTGVQRADTAVRRSLARLALPDPGRAPEPPTAHRIRHASDSDDEVRGVVREVVAALRRRPAHRIAVLHAATVPYARLLHEQFAQAGIAINGPGTVPVVERSIARGLLGLLELAGGGLPRAELFRALADAPARGPDGERIPLSRWERVSRLAGVVEGDDWRARLGAFITGQQQAIDAEREREDPHPGRIEAAERQIDAATGLREFVGWLRALLDQGAGLSDWPSLAGWALSLLHQIYRGGETFAGLPPEEQYAAAAVEQALSGLAGLAEFEAEADVAALRETLAMTLESALPRIGQVGDGVFVAPLSAAVGLDADEVFVVGLTEDLYPGRMHPDPLLPDEVRELAGGALPDTRDQLDARHRHLLASFVSAASVTVFFPRGDLRRSTSRLPSRWLLPTFRELSGNRDLAATDWESVRSAAVVGAASQAAELLQSSQLATEQDWRIRAVVAGQRLADPALTAAVTMIGERAGAALTRFDGNLAGVTGLPDYAAQERRVSPTALESYAECPHAYFVRRLLRVEPLEQPEATITISATDIGTFIHRCMDLLVRACDGDLPGFGRPWTDRHRALLADIASQVAAEFEGKGLTGHPRLWEQERRRILADLQNMLTDDDEWRAELDAAVVASELTFGKDGLPPVAVPLPGGGRVLMVGSADKVDRTRTGTLLVTDIKTGSRKRYQQISPEDPVVGGTRLQLPVYAHAARERFGSGDVRAQYWFVRKDRGKRIELPLDQDVEAEYGRTLQILVTSIAAGLFPPKPPEDDDFRWVQCEYCNPDGIGYTELRDRWRSKRHDPALAELLALVDPAAAGSTGGDDGSGERS